MKFGRAVPLSLAFSLVLTLGVQMPAAPAETKKLLWSQEFNSKAGTPVSKTFWTHDIGDGTEAGIPGWGNGERELALESDHTHSKQQETEKKNNKQQQKTSKAHGNEGI